MLPEITACPTPKTGAKLLKRLGINRQFITEMSNKYSYLGAKVGISQEKIRSMVNGLGAEMDADVPISSPAKVISSAKRPKFDKTKYLP
jgi:hypothetical protein